MGPKTVSVAHLDDDILETKRVADALAAYPVKDMAFQVHSFTNPDRFVEHLKQNKDLDILLLDIHLGSVSGIELGGKAKKLLPDAVLIFYSQDLGKLYQGIEQGADDFVVKADDMRELPLRLASAYRLSRRKAERRSAAEKSTAAGRTLRAVAERVPDIVGSAVRSVHISGESGTGKEVAVGLIAAELGAAVPFIKVNCGAISRELIESTLFGHLKGAFTGASQDKKGLIEEASGGWIFLDEVASLPRPAQVALLRAIDNQELMRVGDTKTVRIDVRFISACHESIPDLVAAGAFRNDLWQRLKEVHLHLPPLRERLEELDELLDHFCLSEAGGPYVLTAEARHILKSYAWSAGNARELRNCIRVMTEKQVHKLLTPLSIPGDILKHAQPGAESRLPADQDQDQDQDRAAIKLPVDPTQFPRLLQLEEQLLVEAVRFIARTYELTLSKTAELLGVSKSTLSRRLRQARDSGLLGGDEFERFFPSTRERG